METFTQYELEPIHVLMLSVLVLYLGFYLNRKIRTIHMKKSTDPGPYFIALYLH